MYPRDFDYARAQSVQEAIQLLGNHEGAMLLAGGHSLIPILKLRQANPSMLVDIGRIAELKGISRQNGGLLIGALTTHAMVASNTEVPVALEDAARVIADLQVRNRGTVGGNVSHADPASDLPTVFTALGGTFHVSGPSGDRAIPASEFFTGMFETAMADHEILVAVEVPAHSGNTDSAYVKMTNPASGYAMLGAAAVITIEGGEISQANVAVGGLTPRATKAPSVEMALLGKPATESTIEAAAREVGNDLGGEILGDLQAGEEYRKAMAPVYVKRALSIAVQRATR
jgi:aerobic carbon-monoxide dehydrogenase medium subunit